MFHSKLKETLNHSIAKVTSDRDSFVSHPEKDFCVSENSLRSRLFCPLVLKVNPLPSVNSWIFSNVSRCPFYIRLKSKMLPETLETLLIVFCTVFLKYKGVPFWCQPIHRTPTHIDR